MRDDPVNVEPRFLQSRTCHFWTALISAGASLLGGALSSRSSSKAADTQVEAARIAAEVDREALGFTREMYNVGRADLAPYRATGAGALQTLNQMFIPGGHPMVQMQGRLNELRAQRARLMSGSQASGQANQLGPGGVGLPSTGLREGGGGASGDAAQAFQQAFRDEFGRDFGSPSAATGLGAIGDALNDDMEDDFGSSGGNGGDRDGRSAREHDRDRDQSRGDAASQSGPR